MPEDNQSTQTMENTQTQEPEQQSPSDEGAFSWKSQLSADFANSPTIKKFADTKKGFNEAVKSHLTLEKLLGNEKVPVPKGPDDLAAKAIFNKAMGIPDKPEGYALPDIEFPESMGKRLFDKPKFAEAVHKYELTPAAAKGLWEEYTNMSKQAYMEAIKAHQDKMTEVINQTRAEWGDAYQAKVELGQMVINKFSENQEMNDYITATLSQDPRGIKFLAKLGDQFAENKIGDFKYQRHSLTPEEAQRELDAIRRDMNHPYNNEKLSQIERDRAIDYVNSLIAVSRKPRG